MSTTHSDAQTIRYLRQENTRLRRELAEARPEWEGVTVRPEFRLTERPDPPPKPRLSLEEHRALVAQTAEMWRAPDRAEDPDA